MNNNKTKRFVTLTIFGALIVVLQLIATFINFGSFPITLTLIPIIIAGAIYGPVVGMLMGLIFGIVVDLLVILGLDAGGLVMFNSKPIITILLCIVKGVLSGFISAIAYKNISNKKIAIYVSSFLAPFVNTLVFYFGLFMFFDISFIAVVGGVTSINFIIELLIDILLAPGLLRVINMRKKI